MSGGGNYPFVRWDEFQTRSVFSSASKTSEAREGRRKGNKALPDFCFGGRAQGRPGGRDYLPGGAGG